MRPGTEFITFCYTERPEETYRFCEETLSLPLVLDQGGCRIYRVSAGGYLGYCDRPNAGRPSGLILTLVLDDVDGWHDRLTAAGVEVEGPPKETPEYGIYHFFFRDPNGYRFEVQRFLDPEWSRGR